MKVIYKKTIRDEIRDIINQAKIDGREIEKIIMSDVEFEKFKSEDPTQDISGRASCGVRIEVVSSETFLTWLYSARTMEAIMLLKMWKQKPNPKPGVLSSKSHWESFIKNTNYPVSYFNGLWNNYIEDKQ